MREGSLDAPTRHALDWTDPDFYDWDKINAEAERIFDICHGCRRCFNLCDSFPRLFDLVDDSPSGELDSVDKADYKKVVDACTLCDMCFMQMCPYVPPHEFDLDFPHLMLRYRAAELRDKKNDRAAAQLTETDRNGKLTSLVPGVANWGSACGNHLTRPLLEKTVHIHREAALPRCEGSGLAKAMAKAPPARNGKAPAKARKAAVYATCFVNYNDHAPGEAAIKVLAKNGVETKVVYPQCCGMPQLEQGNFARVADSARKIAAEMVPLIEVGYDIVALTPSCALMLKFEWPLIVPNDENVKRLSQATFDITEYVVDIARREGLAEGLQPLDGGVAVHVACHARAQNMGVKARELLKLIPEADLKVLPRCSGHGGSWGVLKDNFEVALKVGKPLARDALKAEKRYLVSECPLAGKHILQGMQRLASEKPDGPQPKAERAQHPIELFARAYGL